MRFQQQRTFREQLEQTVYKLAGRLKAEGKACLQRTLICLSRKSFPTLSM